MTVAELGERMSYRELREWMAYYEVEPWGAERDDLRSGIATSAIVRMWADPKKAKAITPALFMPFYEAPPKHEPTPDELRARFDGLMQNAR